MITWSNTDRVLLAHLRSQWQGWKDIENRKFELMGKTQFLCFNNFVVEELDIFDTII